MQKQERLLIKQIGGGLALDENLPKYGILLSKTYYEYALVQLAMNLYILWEQLEEQPQTDGFVTEALKNVRQWIKTCILDGSSERREELKRIHELREQITARMQILTAYTDGLQVYEYILNRLEFTYEEETEDRETDLDAYAQKIFRYLFQDDDKMVINSKIQMVVSELPVRITKSRFFDIINESLKLYTGSECSSVDDFAETIRACSGLFRPEGFETVYPEFFKTLTLYEGLDYQNLSKEQWKKYRTGLLDTADKIDHIVSQLLILAEVVNHLYAAVSAAVYVQIDTKEAEIACRILEHTLSAMDGHDPMKEETEDCLFALEGIPEQLSEKKIQTEGVLFDIWTQQQDLLKSLSLWEEYSDLNRMSKLLCNSTFVSLEAEDLTPEIADSIYINQVRDQLIEEFTRSFAGQTKQMNRARMAMVLGIVPVFFNSQEEISDYLKYALENCKNQWEEKAVIRILDEMMEG